ncbi:MAG: choice-of-anchor K domain-containing protein [Luteolibacter sp.]|uniref:choice-of-anchor K domain-containing protein n=1 Tax=Luteolibacter sp. TaxID=1962973 RepID=UPI0032641E79
MKIPLGFFAILGIVFAIFEISAKAQNLPGSLSFTVSGSFENAASESSNSLLISDNNLTNGYAAGMDLTDAPASLSSSGPTGSAAFQWGTPSTTSNYPHSSALWFEPISGTNISPNEYFSVGNLYYRNGTIKSNTGASAVDIALNLHFSNPSGMPDVNATFTSDLVNSPNSSDPIASADIVSLRNWASPLNYTDAQGNRYYLELTFKVDQNTMDGTLSTQDEFRVFEGDQGRAELLGRFTTSPGAMAIPEPSTAILGLLGAVALFRRKR